MHENAKPYFTKAILPELEKPNSNIEYQLVKILSPLYLAYINLINNDIETAFSNFIITINARGLKHQYNNFFSEYDDSYEELNSHGIKTEILDSIRQRLLNYCKKNL